MEILFSVNGMKIKPFETINLISTLEVYKQCEDFLSLGPVPYASMEMVQTDIDNSVNSKGIFCCIWNESEKQIGVLDFIPEVEIGIAFLDLLMISKQYRYNGIGTSIVKELAVYLKEKYHTKIIKSGVQTNNSIGINFWKKNGFILESIPKDMNDGTVAFQMKKTI